MYIQVYNMMMCTNVRTRSLEILFFSFLNIYIYNACIRIRYYFFLFQTCIYYKPGTRICQNPYPIMGVRVALGNPRITRANPYISLPLPN